ncbi:MAG: dihydroorotase family protein [Candidatus Bathyarchaeia archaeon]
MSARGIGPEQVSSADTVLVNGRLLLRDGVTEGGVAIEDGRIVAVAKNSHLPKAGERVDVHGYLILPGVIDSHVHLRDQGLAYKEDFLSGTSAAACGGVTTVLDMPNNEPLTADADSVLQRMSLAKGRVLVNVGFYAAPTPDLKALHETAGAGIVAFKLFLSRKLAGVNVEDDNLLRGIFEEVAKLHLPLAVHAEDYGFLEKARREAQSSQRGDVKDYLEAHRPEAESIAVRRALRLAEGLDLKLHFSHVSLGSSLSAIHAARMRGRPFTAEVTPQHLVLLRGLLLERGATALADPPFRSRKAQAGLWRGLKLGWVDVVASDHAPHSVEEKRREDVWQVRTGFPGLETLLPLLLNEVNSGRLTLQELVKLASEGPARVFALQRRGSLSPGCWADITIVDLHRELVVDPTRFKSKAHYSPFEGMRLRGLPVMAFVNGVKVMEEQEIVARPGEGSIVQNGSRNDSSELSRAAER